MEQKTDDCWAAAAEYAEGQLMDALRVMVDMMQDKDQASTARATVIKTFVDVAVKLHELRDPSGGAFDQIAALIQAIGNGPAEDFADFI